MPASGQSESDQPASDQVTRDAAMAILEPVAGMLLSRQMRYSEAEDLLKMAYLVSCARAYAAQNMPASVSALSVATGIRRREVKRLLDAAPNVSPPVSMAAQLLLRWRIDSRFLDARGNPKRLPRSGSRRERGFDDLAAAVSRDIHPRALLTELVRLGVAAERDDLIELLPEKARAKAHRNHMMRIAGANVGDHASATLINLLSDPPPLLERAVLADGLTRASAQQATELAASVWQQAVGMLREELQSLVDLDRDANENDWRVRIGMYGYLAPQERPAPPVKSRSRVPNRSDGASPVSTES